MQYQKTYHQTNKLVYPVVSTETHSSHQWEAKFPPLELVTKPNLTTEEIAYYTNKAEQTWRLHACKETYPAGLRPFKIGRDLNWPTAGVKKLCGV